MDTKGKSKMEEQIQKFFGQGDTREHDEKDSMRISLTDHAHNATLLYGLQGLPIQRANYSTSMTIQKKGK